MRDCAWRGCVPLPLVLAMCAWAGLAGSCALVCRQPGPRVLAPLLGRLQIIDWAFDAGWDKEKGGLYYFLDAQGYSPGAWYRHASGQCLRQRGRVCGGGGGGADVGKDAPALVAKPLHTLSPRCPVVRVSATGVEHEAVVASL